MMYPLISLILSSSLLMSSTMQQTFLPEDNILIDCGSSRTTRIEGRTFNSDLKAKASAHLKTNSNVVIAVKSIPRIVSSSSSNMQSLYTTARIFPHNSSYNFNISMPGTLHWIRLYFFPLPHPIYNLTSAVFNVHTDSILLLNNFSVPNNSKFIFKEYLLNITSHNFSLYFSPKNNSLAFINAIELVSAPDFIIPNSASVGDKFIALNARAIEVCYRLNVGGTLITPKNDPLSRTWSTDAEFLQFPQDTQNVSVQPKSVQYPVGRDMEFIAPASVYSTAEVISESAVPKYNLTWAMPINPSFSYMIRFHWCDIVSISPDKLFLDVHVNGLLVVSRLGLSQLTSYFQDLVINPPALTTGYITLQIGPSKIMQSNRTNAILNGLEIMKLSNSAGSLDGLFSVPGDFKEGQTTSLKPSTIAYVGLALSVFLFLLVTAFLVLWPNWEKNSFLSRHSPNPSHSTFLWSKSSSSSRMPNLIGPNMSPQTRDNSFFKPDGLGRFYAFQELQDATQNFDEKTQIDGIGAFRKVYLGTLPDGTKLTIKRGINPSSEQGINQFQMEIQKLTELRHPHVVSLYGYCDEHSEMLLVGEYMVNGSLRDRLYGTGLSPLPWEKKLQICIGAARGLLFLHNRGTEGVVIHGAVNTSNILIDDHFYARVSDFGLYIADQTHVRTADMGSFGYLAPEYYRTGLTKKSDVYSFGVVLFEVLCARPPVDPTREREEEVMLTKWAMQWKKEGVLEMMWDPCLDRRLVCSDSLKKFCKIAERCLLRDEDKRPTMGDVLCELECALYLQKEVSTT